MKKLLTIIFTMLVGGFMLVAPVSAVCPEGCVPTSILGNSTGSDGEKCSCDDGKGSGISDVLKLVIRVMTVGIGVFAVIGITIAGVQYLTAGDKEEQVRKSKRRIIEIIIGVIVFVLLYTILSWLIPDFDPSSIWS